jgi:hypothetical protein
MGSHLVRALLLILRNSVMNSFIKPETSVENLPIPLNRDVFLRTLI